MILFDSIYDKGFQAGINAERLSNKEAQNHRLEDMLHRGKEIGFNEGFQDGYKKGYECGYSEGELDTRARNGIVELDDLAELEDDVAGRNGNYFVNYKHFGANQNKEAMEKMERIRICDVVDGCEDCPRYGDDCDGMEAEE